MPPRSSHSRGKMAAVMAMQSNKKPKQVAVIEEEDPLKNDPMWQAIQGAGTALHRARGLHGLDIDTSKRWDFMHGASKEMLTGIIRESGYQMPAGSEKWNIEAIRAYLKMQGVNFIPNGYVVRTIGAAVKLQSAFRTFVVRRLIDNLKAAREMDKKTNTPKRTKTASPNKDSKSKKEGGEEGDVGVVPKKMSSKGESPKKKDSVVSISKSDNDAAIARETIKIDTPKFKETKLRTDEALSDQLPVEVPDEPMATEKKTDSLHYFDAVRNNTTSNQHEDDANEDDYLKERDRLAQRLLTRVDSGSISSPLHDSKENKFAAMDMLSRDPPTVEVLHAKEMKRQESRNSLMNSGDDTHDINLALEEFFVTPQSDTLNQIDPTSPTNTVRQRPRSAPMNRKTLKPVVCTIRTKKVSAQSKSAHRKSSRKSSHGGFEGDTVKEALFRRAVLGRPSSANQARSKSPTRFLSSRYPPMDERRKRHSQRHSQKQQKEQQLNDIDMEAQVNWGETLADEVIYKGRASGSGAMAVKTLGVSIHPHLNQSERQPNSHSSGKFIAESSLKKKNVETEEMQRQKLIALKKTRRKEAEIREQLSEAMRAQYYHGGVIQDYTVARTRTDTEPSVQPPKIDPLEKRRSGRRVSEAHQPSKLYTPLVAEVQPISSAPRNKLSNHVNGHQKVVDNEPMSAKQLSLSGWSSVSRQDSDFPASPLYFDKKRSKSFV